MPQPPPPAKLGLEAVRARLLAACRRYGRDPDTVRLLAVSKAQPLAALQAMAAAGQTCFGESYVQEAVEKITQLGRDGYEWHFIGPLQSNKTALVAENFDWVHSIDRLKIAERLSRQRPANQAPLQVCLQLNISAEASKSGVSPDALPELAEAVTQLPALHLRGIMAIPARSNDFDQQRRTFHQVHEAYGALRRAGLALDTLSMGMSDDLEAAVAEGSTLVRIGSALFGPRPPRG